MPVAVEKKVMFSTECLEKPPDNTNSVIFQTVFPRRRKDRFGRDATKQSDFLLSATVFPTGVRAPALEELQQRCGPVCRVDPLRAGPSGVFPGDAWPGSGPKILTLRKSKTMRQDSPQSSPRSSNYLRSSTESMSSLRSYNWTPRKKKKDVRDPMYFNTYCSDERTLRFKDSNLPRIAKSRPWSVGESNPSKRFVKVNTEARKSAGKITNITRIQGTPLQRPRQPFHTAANREDSEQYFEVKRMSADQRSRVRGQETCLYSQVRQCVRLVKNHDTQKARHTERPMKAEVGKYRPFSTTRIRTPCPSPVPPVLLYKDQDSADTYRQYMMSKALMTRAGGPKSAGTIVSGVVARNNTAASSYHDTEILQSVADSNIPYRDPNAVSEVSSEDNQQDRRHSDNPLTLGLDIRGATIVAPAKAVKSRTTDSNSDKAASVYSPNKEAHSSKDVHSPKKEVLITRRRERSKTSEKSGSDIGIKMTVVPVYSPEPEPIAIQLDDMGNPLIWQHTPLETSTPDLGVIKIPAVGMSTLSIEDTEDTDTHDES